MRCNRDYILHSTNGRIILPVNIIHLLTGWAFFLVGLPPTILGLFMVTDEVKAFKAARFLFWLSALWMWGKIMWWGFNSTESFFLRSIAIFIACGLIGVGLTEALRLTARRETYHEPSPALSANPPTPSPQTHPEKTAPEPIITMTQEQFQTLMGAIAPQSQPPVKAKKNPTDSHSDLRYIFYGKDRLMFEYKNTSPDTALKPRIFFGLMDLSNPYFYSPIPGEPPTPQPFPIPVRVLSDDYVRPGETAGNEDLLRNFMGHIRPGDVIWGVATITCINCEKQRAYYIHWKAGTGGWYAEADDPNSLQMPQPVTTPFSDDQIISYVDKIVPMNERQQMKETFSAPPAKKNNAALRKRIGELIAQGTKIRDKAPVWIGEAPADIQAEWMSWTGDVEKFLGSNFDSAEVEKFRSFKDPEVSLNSMIHGEIGDLEQLLDRIRD
jgi:hypothetical protein